jgi:broad specificity phosphatase PhoE
MDVFIIRHGQSYNNALADMSERVADPPLTQKGVRQADRVAAHLAGGGHLLESERGNGKPLLDELHCSAMARALETARPIGEAMRLKTQVWVDIHEVGGLFLDHGPGGGGHGADGGGIESFPGKTRSQIEEEFEGFVPNGVDHDGWWRGGREAEQTGRGRAIGVAEKLMSRAREDIRLGLVSHGDFICGLLKALGDHLPSRGLWYDHHNTAVTRLRLSGSGRIVVNYMNRFDHLSDDLLT